MKISLWVPWSDRELWVFEQVVGEYDAAHPEVEVELVGGVNDDKILQSMRAGNAGDVVASFDSANVGKACESGGWVDLSEQLATDGIDVNIFPATTRYYTSYDGKRARCRSWPTPTGCTTTTRCSPRPASAGRRRPWTSSWTTPRS